MKKWFIAVTAGKWQYSSIRYLKNLGFQVVAIDSDPLAEAFSLSDFNIVSNLSNVQYVLNQLDSLGVTFSGVASFVSDAGLNLTSIIREHYKLPGPSIAVTLCLTNKYLQRVACQQHVVPIPKFMKAHSYEEVLDAEEIIGYPLIIKPVDSSGSRGVSVKWSRNEFSEEDFNNAMSFSNTSTVIIEEYMIGKEYAVDSFSLSGVHTVLAITEKKKLSGAASNIAYELFTPELPKSIIDKIENVVNSTYDAIRYTDGPGHCEVIVKDDQTVGLIEAAGRGGGFMVYEKLVPAISGVDLIDLTIRNALGHSINIGFIEKKKALLHFLPTRKGRLVNATGIEQASLLTGVSVGLLISIDQIMSDPSSDGSRLAWLLCTGDTLAEAEARLQQAKNCTSFTIDESY